MNEKKLKEEDTKDSVVSTVNSEKAKQAGNDYLRSKDYDMALECYSKAISLNSSNSAAYFNRALVYLKKKVFNKALEDCDQAISLKSEYVKAYHRRAKVLIQLKEYTRAISDLELVLQHEPENNEAINEIKKSREEAGKITGYRRINIIEADEEDDEENEKEDEQEEEEQDTDIPQKKAEPKVYEVFDEDEEKESDFPKKTVEVFKEIVNFEDFLKGIEEVKKTGNDFFKVEDYDQAISEFSKAIQCVERHYTDEQVLLEPTLLAITIALLNNRALSFSRLDCNNEAIQDSLRVVKLDHNNAKALYRIGKCEACRNNFKEAARRMKQVIEISPDNVVARKECEEYSNKFAEIIDIEKLPLTPRRMSGVKMGEETKKEFSFENEKEKLYERRVSFRAEDFDEMALLEKQTSKQYRECNSKFPKGKLEAHESDEDDEDNENLIEKFTPHKAEAQTGEFTLEINPEKKPHKVQAVHISQETISNAKEIASKLVSNFEVPKTVLMFETAAKALKQDLGQFYTYIRVIYM